MKALQFTFISKTTRATFSVIGSDHQDATKTAFQLANHIPLPCAVVCKPIKFTREQKPCTH